MTVVRHDNEEATKVSKLSSSHYRSSYPPSKVDGFQEAGSFRQEIHYQADATAVLALVKAAGRCSQRLTFDCFNSRLMGFGWWEAQNGEKADHWPGGREGGCACGVTNSCANNSATCNCDGGIEGRWLQDGGEVVKKDQLPVKAVHFGDTGTPLDDKEGRFSLGPLQCWDREPKEARGPQRVTANGSGHINSVYLEFKLEEGSEKEVTIVETSTTNSSGKLRVEGEEIVYLWTEVPGDFHRRLAVKFHRKDLKWHSVIVEQNMVEVSLVLDRQHSSSASSGSQSETNTRKDFNVDDLKVREYCCDVSSYTIPNLSPQYEAGVRRQEGRRGCEGSRL